MSFSENVTARDYEQWLHGLQSSQALSLYFHVPFCRQLCWFCGCHTKIVHRYEPIKKYLALLESEVELVRGHLPDSPVSHVHFGGGSPTVVSAGDFREFMAVLGSRFNLDENTDIDIEMDPRTLDREKVAAYAECGVSRASLGVQDFDDAVQRAINRIQPYPMVRSMLDVLRTHGIRKINIDLIYGLPGQTLDTIRETVQKTVALDPDRISLFGYAHVPWMKKHQSMIPEAQLPDPPLRVEMFETATDLLMAAGYIPIGLDHFAKPMILSQSLLPTVRCSAISRGTPLTALKPWSVLASPQFPAYPAVMYRTLRAFGNIENLFCPGRFQSPGVFR